jgi:hypothetical protein
MASRTPIACKKLQALTDAALAHLELDALLPNRTFACAHGGDLVYDQGARGARFTLIIPQP